MHQSGRYKWIKPYGFNISDDSEVPKKEKKIAQEKEEIEVGIKRNQRRKKVERIKKNKRHEKHEHSYFLTIQFHTPSHPINQFLVFYNSTPSVTSCPLSAYFSVISYLHQYDLCRYYQQRILGPACFGSNVSKEDESCPNL